MESADRPPHQAHPWHGVAAETGRPSSFNAFIEIVPTDTVKYELDKASGHLRIDRPQLFSSVCPTLYGFIPRTFCGDRVARRCAERTALQDISGDLDPMDICVLTEKAVTHGGLFVSARPIGGLRMIDDSHADDKIIAVLEADLVYGHFSDLSECPAGVVERLKHYFLNYKQAPEKHSRKIHIAELFGRDEALELIRLSALDYREHFEKSSAEPKPRSAIVRT
jgi:inorganic pyrophosphatase